VFYYALNLGGIHMSQSPLQRVIKLIGTQVALAKAIGVKQAHIWNWLNRDGGEVPPAYVLKACSAVEWKVTPHELRPDIYPNTTDGMPATIEADA
jgi:DNA-binding transcriptional regulator YdaS (Cro superfamily)